MPEISQQLLDDLERATGKVINSYTLYPLNQELISIGETSSNKNLDFDEIEHGRIGIVFSISAIDKDSSPTAVRLGLNDGVSDYWHKVKTSPTADETVTYIGNLVLAEGDFIRARFEGVTSGDDLYGFMNGYWINL